MAVNPQGTHKQEANLYLLARKEMVWKRSGSPGGLGFSSVSHDRSGVEQEEVGNEVHHWGICSWGEHAMLALPHSEPVAVSLCWTTH